VPHRLHPDASHHHEVYGFTQRGGHEDFLKVPASTCVPLPDALSFEEGAACACGTGKELITHRFTLGQAAEAYRLFDTGRTGKVILVWP
jgi:threonine dehydrogenase-like Zn-dependent dehydrogenase